MAARVRSFPKSQHDIFHRTLIKLLMVQELSNFNKYWDHFLLFYEFETFETKSPLNVVNILSANLGPSETFENVEIDDFVA